MILYVSGPDQPFDQIRELFQAVGWDARLSSLRHCLTHSTFLITAREIVRESAVTPARGDGPFQTAPVGHTRPRVVGFARVLSDGVDFSLLSDVVVAPGFRRRGIGTGLVTRCLAAFPDTQFLMPACDSRLEPFYMRFGFNPADGDWLMTPTNE